MPKPGIPPQEKGDLGGRQTSEKPVQFQTASNTSHERLPEQNTYQKEDGSLPAIGDENHADAEEEDEAEKETAPHFKT